MGIQNYSYEDVVEYAVLIEQRGIKLYTRAAEGTKNEPARNILLHLAEQERKHEEYFLKLKENVHTGGSRKVDVEDETIGYLSALAKSEIFPDSEDSFQERFKTLKDVVDFGKQAEKDSILFYNELITLGWDERTKDILRAIIREEKKHLVQLAELNELIAERDIYY
ncbi:MAG TPA: ferritin family protein [Clostridiales bacterium]|nr:ferritin family protein [Clostridiales bacterium]